MNSSLVATYRGCKYKKEASGSIGSEALPILSYKDRYDQRTPNHLNSARMPRMCPFCIFSFLSFFMISNFFAPLDIKLATLLKVKLWLGCWVGSLLVRVCCRLKDVAPYKVSGWGRGLKYRTKYTCSLFNTNPAPSPKEILRSFQQKSATHLILSTQPALIGGKSAERILATGDCRRCLL